MIYLDTHILLWIYAGYQDKISKDTLEKMNKSELLISPMVILEVEYLYEINKITENPDKIILDSFSRFGIKQCELPFNQIIQESRKMKWTRDPFDRIITATAALNNNFLVSKDISIQENYQKTIF